MKVIKKHWALYVRLSHEDGDKTESLSICNQKLKLLSFIKGMSEISNYKFYVDDGFSGTNFERPGFNNLINDIHSGLITGIIVKDLSRLGRNSPKTSYFIHDFFPSNKIRFIAIDDNIDKNFFDFDTSNDMIIDIKNMFNGFYPRDISSKVRSTLRAKQTEGQFIGAFACYGYKKSPTDHNKLIIDIDAADVVKQIYALYISGMGQNTIAKLLNASNIPCPSEYKKMQGLNYKNGNRLNYTTYWTYSSIRHILKNEMYTGCMVQNKSFRTLCSKTVSALPKDKWIIVPDTHEPIIDKQTFDRVQALLSNNIRQPPLKNNIHLLAGIIKCGDCGRSMVKISRNNKSVFVCGSYNRYGKNTCSSHRISESSILRFITNDFNKLLKETDNLEHFLYKEYSSLNKSPHNQKINEHIQYKINRLEQKKINYAEDLNESLISENEYDNFIRRCNLQISTLKKQLDRTPPKKSDNIFSFDSENVPDILKELLKNNEITKPDRTILTQLVNCIYIYENRTVKIVYNVDHL